MFYVPCIVANDKSMFEGFYKCKNIEDTFKIKNVTDSKNIFKIYRRGIPQSLVDVYSFNDNVIILEGLN